MKCQIVAAPGSEVVIFNFIPITAAAKRVDISEIVDIHRDELRNMPSTTIITFNATSEDPSIMHSIYAYRAPTSSLSDWLPTINKILNKVEETKKVSGAYPELNHEVVSSNSI